MAASSRSSAAAILTGMSDAYGGGGSSERDLRDWAPRLWQSLRRRLRRSKIAPTRRRLRRSKIAPTRPPRHDANTCKVLMAPDRLSVWAQRLVDTG